MNPFKISVASAAILAAASLGAQAQDEKRPLDAPNVQQAPKQDGQKGGDRAQPGEKMQQGGAEKSGGMDKQRPMEGKDTAQGKKPEMDGKSADHQRMDKDKAADQQKPDNQKSADQQKMDKDKSANEQKPDNQKSADQNQGGGGEKPQKEAHKEIKPEQKTVIKQTFVKENIRPEKINVQVRVGVAIPRTVHLHPVPPTLIEVYPSYSRYKLVMVDEDTILIVDPITWEIVDVIEV
jgi:hypothetical protein